MNDNTTIITAQQCDEIISSNGHASSDHVLAAERVGEPTMKLVAIPRSDPPLADGPCHPYTWRHAGNPIGDHMQPGAWKLVDHIWKQQNLAATFDDLKHPVYDDREHTADDDAFGSLRRAANNFFKTHGLSWRVCIKKRIVHLRFSK